MSWTSIALGIFGLALLMVVHEGGHYLAARAFGIRVVKFSIGLGPVLWSYQAKDTGTVFQVALIPFLAYVQIAGMNPYEEVDPRDRSSYANASVVARITAIFGGPLANYLFASVLFFAALTVGGRLVHTLEVDVAPNGAAQAGQMQSGDRIQQVNGVKITDFEHMRKVVLGSPDRPLTFAVERAGKLVELKITPRPKAENGGGQIGVTPRSIRVPIAMSEAAVDSVVMPAQVVEALVVGLARIMTLKEKPQLMGPLGIAKETGKAADEGWNYYLRFLGMLSAYLGGFNLVPFPALDGGRLVFLGYEAVTRRRPNARMEAHIHFVGLVMLLLLITVVSVFDVTR